MVALRRPSPAASTSASRLRYSHVHPENGESRESLLSVAGKLRETPSDRCTNAALPITRGGALMRPATRTRILFSSALAISSSSGEGFWPSGSLGSNLLKLAATDVIVSSPAGVSLTLLRSNLFG